MEQQANYKSTELSNLHHSVLMQVSDLSLFDLRVFCENIGASVNVYKFKEFFKCDVYKDNLLLKEGYKLYECEFVAEKTTLSLIHKKILNK